MQQSIKIRAYYSVEIWQTPSPPGDQSSHQKWEIIPVEYTFDVGNEKVLYLHSFPPQNP